MKVKITLTAKKTYEMDYPDNDFSDEVLRDNFWLYKFDDNEFSNCIKFKMERIAEDKDNDKTIDR